MAQKRQMKLGAFMYPGGHHVAAWRHPDVSATATTDFAYRVTFAQAAERAKFDLIFLADGVGVSESRIDALSRVDEWSNGFEPITLLSALSAVTERIGLVATASTSFTEPFNLARYFASLDQLSEGRAGWNLVTSSDGIEAQNFNPKSGLLHADRYDRANEFADVVLGLWNSWEDDAFLRDKESGRFFDPAKLHILHHQGKHFQVRGPAECRPLAPGASGADPGRFLGCRQGIGGAHGGGGVHRATDARRCAIVLRRSEGAAAEIRPPRRRSESDARRVSGGWAAARPKRRTSSSNCRTSSIPMSAWPCSRPISGISISPSIRSTGRCRICPESNASKSRQQLFIDLARRENLSIRQLYLRIAGARGRWQLIGTAEQIVDELGGAVPQRRRRRFQHHAADRARWARRFHRAGAAGTAPPRPVPPRI